MPQGPTLITTAVTTEAAPLANGLKLRRDRRMLPGAPAWRGITGSGEPVVLLSTGMGRCRAAQLTAAALDRLAPRRVLITGFAGGLDPGLALGDLFTPEAVLDGESGQEWRPTWPAAGTGRLVTVDRLADTPAAKAQLRARHGAGAVDMETAAMAAECQRRGVPWGAMRAISDPHDAELPAFLLKLTKPGGRPDLLAAVLHAAMHPADVPRLIRLGRESGAAARNLAAGVVQLLNEPRPSGRGADGPG